ncbi:PilX N-terminal domain-containing pilus assembly protein [Planctomycetota bacterium]
MNNSCNDPRSTRLHSRNGIVLIVVLGVLALLSILALTFVSMTRLERSISMNYVERTRAVLAAESGIEAAIARLSGFHGGVLRPEEYEQMQYNPDDRLADLEKAGKPSFMCAETGPGGRVISGIVGGTHIAGGDCFQLKVEDESGKLNLNDTNALMEPGDPAQGIPGDPTSGRLFHLVNNLAEILYAEDKGPGIGAVIAYTIFSDRDRLGGRFSTMRQVDEALGRDECSLNPQERKKFLSNVTLWSWQDPDVIKPNPRERSYIDTNALNYIDPAIKDQMADPSQGYGIPFMRWAEVQTVGYTLEPRSPVNINTASVELIEALLTDLEGWTLFEGPAEIYGSPHRYSVSGSWSIQKEVTNYRYEQKNRSRICSILLAGSPNGGAFADASCSDGETVRSVLPYARLRRTEITPEMATWLAQDLYERIHGSDSNPIENWREFETYLQTVAERARSESVPELAYTDVFKSTETLGQFDAKGYSMDWGYDRSGDFDYFNLFHIDVILANLDPNTMSNDFNPDQCVMRLTDKADLEVYTTEACFEPTGVFAVESQGSVASSAGEILASVHASCLVQLFEFKRLTTQKDLFGPDQISDLKSRFGDNQSPYRTNWETMTITYPEPIKGSIGVPEFDHINDAIFDGRVGLSPVKHDGVQHKASLWTYFEGNFNAYDPAEVSRQSYPEDPAVYSCYSTVQEEFADGMLMGPDMPGQLYPDGCFSEAWSSILYPAEGHLSPPGLYGESQTTSRGAWLMTVKPNFMPEHSNRIRQFLHLGQGNKSYNPQSMVMCSYFPHRNDITSSFNRSTYEYFSYEPWGLPWLATRAFVFGFGHDGNVCGGIFSETANETGVDLLEPMAYRFEGHRWNILSGCWTFRESPEIHLTIQMQINGKKVDDIRQQLPPWGSTFFLTTAGTSLLNPHRPGETFIMPIKLGGFARRFLGEPIEVDMYNMNYSADSTYREFMLMTNPEENLLEYVAEWDAACFLTNEAEPLYYVTPPINLGAKANKEVTVRSISWTGRWPDEVNSDNFNTEADSNRPDPAWDNDWDPFTVDIKANAGQGDSEWLYAQTMDLEPPDTQLSYSGGSRPVKPDGMLVRSAGPLQLKFYFNVKSNVNQPHPVRESPYLDDITITWCPAGGAKILFYELH